MLFSLSCYTTQYGKSCAISLMKQDHYKIQPSMDICNAMHVLNVKNKEIFFLKNIWISYMRVSILTIETL